MRKRIKIVNTYIEKGNVLIYGGGQTTQILLAGLRKSLFFNRICGIIDSNPDLHGKSILGVPIHGLHAIKEQRAEFIIISVQSEETSTEIEQSLAEMNLNLQIINLNSACDNQKIYFDLLCRLRTVKGDNGVFKRRTYKVYPKNKKIETSFLLSPPSKFLLSKQTSIVSIGSCFATRIKEWLILNGYNFKSYQPWGAVGYSGSFRNREVYNSFNILQEFERAFGSFGSKVPFWELDEDEEKLLLDPYRKYIAWFDHQAMEQELEEHRQQLTKGLKECEILILTVGQAEIWYSTDDGTVYHSRPPKQFFNPQRDRFRLSTVEENFDNLEKIFQMYHTNNPKGKIIISVSPVPLRATFQDINSIVANTESKSILRAAVGQFVKEHPDFVSYFPSFEIVTQLAESPFEADNRHVTDETVNLIMNFFNQYYIESKGAET